MDEIEQLQLQIKDLKRENKQLKRIVYDLLEHNEIAIANISDPVENFKQFNAKMTKIVSSVIKLND